VARSSLVPLLVLAGSVFVAAGPAATAATHPRSSPGGRAFCGSGWTSVPNVGTQFGSFYGLSAVGPTDIWMVGSSGTVPTALAEHFDGTAWSEVPVVQVLETYLHGVAAIASDDVWAVGNAEKGPGDESRTIAERWDGTQFSVVPTPNIGTGYNDLEDVAASSSSDAWAVGFGTNTGLIEHWDGTTWTIVPAPAPGAIHSVAAVSANDVWAVGAGATLNDPGVILHWNGSYWATVDNPSDGTLDGITALSADDVWAVGQEGGDALVEHWDGTAWTASTLPWKLDLRGVAAGSPTDIWAVSDLYDGLPYILHWDGSSWSSFPGAASLRDVIVLSQFDAWTAGRNDYPTYLPPLLHFCPAEVSDGGFVPATVSSIPGNTVIWRFDQTNQSDHSVTDTTGLGLFDSGLQPPGALFSYTFTAAGGYPVIDQGGGAGSQVNVPLLAFPKRGTSATPFTITWALSHAQGNEVYDVQVKPPGSGWQDWLTGDQDKKATYYAGPAGGRYSFRARLRDSTTGAATNFSPAATIRVQSLTSDVGVVGYDSPDPVSVGSDLTYSLVVTNAGPDSAGNVTVVDPLPGSVTFVSASSTSGSCSGTDTVTCVIGHMNKGESEIVTIVVTPNEAGALTDQATASTTSSDPDPGNNTTTIDTTVTG